MPCDSRSMPGSSTRHRALGPERRTRPTAASIASFSRRFARTTDAPALRNFDWHGEVRYNVPATADLYPKWLEEQATPKSMKRVAENQIGIGDNLELHFSELQLDAFVATVREISAVAERTVILLAPRNLKWMVVTPEGRARYPQAAIADAKSRKKRESQFWTTPSHARLLAQRLHATRLPPQRDDVEPTKVVRPSRGHLVAWRGPALIPFRARGGSFPPEDADVAFRDDARAGVRAGAHAVARPTMWTP